MAATLAELEDRVAVIENDLRPAIEVLNNIQTAITNLASIEQLRRINAIRQEEIDDLTTSYQDLRRIVELIQAEVFK